MFPEIKLIFAIWLGLSVLQQHVLPAHGDDDKSRPSYPIPNPFEPRSSVYYYIKSYQKSLSSHKNTAELTVEEYFSLVTGITYSLHQDRNDPSARPFALIGDGTQGKYYIVRDPDSDDSFECELDHLHSNKHVFPWQYEYEISADQMGKKESKKSNKKIKKTTKSSIYGIGAIWLNAIGRQITSSQVADESPLPGSNVWTMSERDLVVKMMFDKPMASRSADMSALIASSKLNSIRVDHEQVLEHDKSSPGGATNAIGVEIDYITVREFNPKVSADNPVLDRLKYQLERCRASSEKHRVFPSLMRALSLSPKRMFGIEYVERKFGPSTGQSGEYETAMRRHTWSTEVHSELFSFIEETQVNVYEGLPSEMTEVADPLATPTSEYADIFLRRFTEAEKSRSSRHSTVTYHMFDKSGEIERCLKEDEPLPSDHLMIRPIHFLRPQGRRLTGHLTGVGALIMNAGDVHYKQFSLFRREVGVANDPYDLHARKNRMVDEWSFYDKKTRRSFHFYFIDRSPDSPSSTPGATVAHDIEDLVRIDVKDASSINTEDKLDSVSPDDDNDENMIVRYDVSSIYTDMRDSRIRFLCKPAPICFKSDVVNDDDDLEDEDDDSEKSDSDDSEFDPDDDWLNFFEPDKPDEDKNGDHREQDEGEEFEFEPGELLESFQFPDFFEFLDGQSAYAAESTIELKPLSSDKEPSRYIQLSESVDFTNEWAMLRIKPMVRGRASSGGATEYYINYNSELVFRVNEDTGSCTLVANVDSWLRLISARITYYKMPNKGSSGGKSSSVAAEVDEDTDSEGNVLIESDKLRLYGVGALWRHASESAYTDFLGMRKGKVERPGGPGKYKEVLWSLADDGDSDMIVNFKFLWNLTQWELDSAKHRSRRTIELLTLDSVYLAEMLGGDVESLASNKASDEYTPSTNFQTFRVKPSFIMKAEPRTLMLPGSCHEVVEICNLEAQQNKQYYYGLLMPSFHSYLETKGSYSIKYSIVHSLPRSQIGPFQTPGQDSMGVLPVAESYDIKQNRGKIVVGSGEDTREIFIDGAKKIIYAYMGSTNTCKRIATLKPLVDVGGVFSAVNNDFNLDKMYGLAALWIATGDLKNVMLSVNYRHDHSGNRFEVRSYRAYYISSSSSKSISNLVRATYVSRRSTAETLARDVENFKFEDFDLESLEFTPELLKGRVVPTTLHKTTTKIESSSFGDKSLNWNLPEECEKLSPDSSTDGGAGGGSQEAAKFPRMMDAIKATEQFYMRSEISLPECASLTCSTTKPFLMDEWLYHKSIRIKTYGLDTNLDLMVYATSMRSFDLSTPYRCPSAWLPVLNSTTVTTTSKFVDFWADYSTLIENLADLYYGPVSLWWLAEKNMKNVQLANSVEIAPKDQPGSSTADLSATSMRLAREMREETWKVTGPSTKDDSGRSSSWSYELHFEKFSRLEPNGKLNEWSVLQRVDIQDPKNGHVMVEVINYNWNQRPAKYRDLFLLPTGYGCTRHPDALAMLRKTNDEIFLNLDFDHWVTYEASLEILDDESDREWQTGFKGKTTLPTVSGTFAKARSVLVSDWDSISAHFYRARYPNGTVTSTKTVYDSNRSLLYTIDRLIGSCRIEYAPVQMGKEWRIEFPSISETSNQKTLINMTPTLFRELFMKTSDLEFVPLNRYKADGFLVSTYERSYATLKVLDRFVGPTTVVRRYMRQVGVERPISFDGQTTTTSHNSMSVKVMIFDSDKTKLQAILRMSLLRFGDTAATEVIRVSNVAQCFYDGSTMSDKKSKWFALDYPLEPDIADIAIYKASNIVYNFTKTLIKNTNISPTQLDGLPRVETDQGTLMRIHFKLLQSPTAVEHFTEIADSTMSDSMAACSEIKLVSSRRKCSKWCDQVGCLAMSYCLDRTCRVVTRTMMKDWLKLWIPLHLASPAPKMCSYYYRGVSSPLSLVSFTDTMNWMVNDAQSLKKEPTSELTASPQFGLVIGWRIVFPSQFYEVKKDFVEINEDLGDDGDEVVSGDLDQTDNSPTGLKNDKIYRMFRLDHVLDMPSLSDYLSGKDSLKTSVYHAKTYGDCLDFCKMTNCIIMSHCKSSGSCMLVIGKGDFKELVKRTRPSQSTGDCVVSIRNFLSGYSKFDGTSEPNSYQIKLDKYSQIECAAACENADGDSGEDDNQFNCLSFDSCHPAGLDPNPDESSESVCYLQKAHLMMDNFDKAILEPKTPARKDARGRDDKKQDLSCRHYSKSFLSDYRRIPNRKFSKAGAVVRGISTEKCALECQQDDECKAFEYCFDGKLKPAQSCYFIHSNELTSDSDEASWSKVLEKSLTMSRECSIYTLRHSRELYKLDETRHTLSLIDLSRLTKEHKGLIQYLIISLCYLVVAIMVGSLIQIVYIKLFGRPVIFNN